jgi:hypothetical protein
MFDLYRIPALLPRTFESVFDVTVVARRLPRMVAVMCLTPPVATDTFGSGADPGSTRDTLEQVFDLRARLP